MITKAVFPGTFDPITYGHLNIIQRASKIIDHLIIGVATSNNKHPLFSPQERLEIIEQQIKNLALSNVQVKIFNGLLVEFMKKEGAKVNIRGLRVSSDFAHEFQLACVNKKIDETIETIFFPAVEENQFISSSFIKEVASMGGDISKFLPDEIVVLLKRKINYLTT